MGYSEGAGLKLGSLPFLFCASLLAGLVMLGDGNCAEATAPDTPIRLAQADVRDGAFQQDPAIQELRRERNRLIRQRDDLLEQQAQLQMEIKDIHHELKLPRVPDEYQVLRCKLADLSAEEHANRVKIGRAKKRIKEIRREMRDYQFRMNQAPPPPPPVMPSQPGPDPLAEVMTQPVIPEVIVPTGLVRQLIGYDVSYIFRTPGTSFEFESDTRTLTYDTFGNGGAFTAEGRFLISDGTRENVRLRFFIDSASGGVPTGLILELGPTYMDAAKASTLVMWGPIGFTVPPGASGIGHITLDVPDDSSIKPENIRFIFR
jgi:hypothetical protein